MSDRHRPFPSAAPPRYTAAAAPPFRHKTTPPAGAAVAAGEERQAASHDQATGSADTVILLHGLGRSSRSMLPLARRLARRGYHVENIDYPSTRLSIPALAERHLAPVVARAGERPGRIHFVTHSMGGILVRSLLAGHQPAALGRIVMLAPPNRGSEIADSFAGLWPLRHLLGPAARQLATADTSLANRLPPPACEVGIIAGNKTLNPLFSSLIPGEDDGTVAVARTVLAGMRDHLVLDTSHTFIMQDARVVAQTIRFLSTGTFAR